jgi:hypothetical protein
MWILQRYGTPPEVAYFYCDGAREAVNRRNSIIAELDADVYLGLR